ncbi:MAG: IgGFc-binding protein [Myxococcales bacterium]|nr:IgGFc-binding protein [Myxococcales bacterium]
MNSRLLLLPLALLLSSALSACSSRPEGTGGSSDAAIPCTEGEIVCRGREAHTCSLGELSLTEVCPIDQACSDGIGCTLCRAGQLFCQGQEVHRCDDLGTGSTLETVCPITEVCTVGVCLDACSAAAAERSNVGCDYYAADLDNEYGVILGMTLNAAGEQFAVVLANPTDVTVQARVLQSVGAIGAPAETLVGTYVVPPYDLVRIDLPQREVDGSVLMMGDGPGTFLSPNAYRILTNYPVVAYQFNPIIESSSNDASLLIPVPALDNHYRVIGWPTANPIAGPIAVEGIPDHSFVTIIGTAPDTLVTVTLGGPIVAGGGIPATPAGGTVEVTLGPYDVLNLESDGAPGDLTGTIVQSTRPVAVFSGGERGQAPVDATGVSGYPGGGSVPGPCCTEHLEEQVFPTIAWGKRFAVTRSPVRTDHPTWREPDIYRLLADKPGTVITTNLPAPHDTFTLGENEWREFSTDRPFVIESNEPISVQQMLVSQEWLVSWKPDHGGDPSMVLFPPVEQYRERYIFLVPETFPANYVVASAPAGTEILLDGVDIHADEFMSICEYEDIGTIDGRLHISATCPVTGGTHRIDASGPAGIMVYGYYAVGSYGYAGGANLTEINLI